MITLDQLKTQMSELTDIDVLLSKFLDERRILQETDTTLRLADLDYTLFSRDEQLEAEPELRAKRGDAGSMHILYHMGLDAYIQKYYSSKKYPNEILSQMNNSSDAIITAGMEKIQNAKISAMGLDHIPLIVTKNGQEKVLATIRYVLYTLKFLPKEIIIYEDRPQYFIEYKQLIEGILGCSVKIMQVEMDGNTGYKMIEEI